MLVQLRLSRKAVSQQFCGFVEMAKKSLCDVTKHQKDEVISKQVSEHKTAGMKWKKKEAVTRSIGATWGSQIKREKVFLCLCVFREGQFSPVRHTQSALWAL